MSTVVEVFETSDIDVAENILARAYGSLQINDPGAGGKLRLCHTTLTPSVRLERNSLTMNMRVGGDAFGSLMIVELRGGRVAYESDGSERRMTPGDVFLAAQPDSPWAGHLVDAELPAAAIAPGMLDQVAAAAPTRKAGPVRFTGYRPVSSQAASVWKHTYAYVQQLADLDAAAEPLVAGPAARTLVAASLATFPNTALTDPTIEDRHDAHPGSLRRAIAFIESYPELDITPRDIARAAHVTVRAVQLAFRRHLGTTPTAYLRRVRLDRADADLQAAVPGDGSTVTEIGARWGYSRPSRFAADYKTAYGRYPHQVLHGR